MIPPKFLCLLLAGFAWQAAQAAPLYKWRDSAGRITYSSLPPPPGLKAEQLKDASQPDAEAIRQAEVRAKKAQELAREMEAARRAEEAEDARRRALQPPAPIVIEKPVYVPQPIYYPPVRHRPPRRHPPDRPPGDRPPHDRSR
jgi:sRNA-binding protein